MCPLTQNPDTRVFLLLFNTAVVFALAWVGNVAWWIPVVNWAVSALFAYGIQDIIQRYKMGETRRGLIFYIAWIILCSTANFASLYMPGDTAPWKIMLPMAGLMVILHLLLSSWQMHNAPVNYLAIGFIVSLLSLIHAPALLWLLLPGLGSIFMRSNSTRNFWSTLTGVVFGIWVSYFCVYFILGETKADNILNSLLNIIPVTLTVPEFSLEVWIVIGITTILLLAYSVTSYLLNVGDSLRVTSVIRLISMMAFMFVLFTALNVSHIALYFSLITLLLTLLNALHLSNVQSDIHEWWTIFILVAMMLLDIIPILIPLVL
jgi:hypothetical protein